MSWLGGLKSKRGWGGGFLDCLPSLTDRKKQANGRLRRQLTHNGFLADVATVSRAAFLGAWALVIPGTGGAGRVLLAGTAVLGVKDVSQGGHVVAVALLSCKEQMRSEAQGENNGGRGANSTLEVFWPEILHFHLAFSNSFGQ